MAAPVLVDEPAPGVRRVRLNRPARRNAVDGALLDGLARALDAAPPVVVLSSADPAAFCAGLDLHLEAAERQRVSDALYALYQRMVAADALIVAAISGAAVGGGAQLAIASDVRVAHPEAWLRFPGAEHGLAVGAWGLPSLIGRGRALRVCTTAERIPAATAHAWGLVDVIDPDPERAALELVAGHAGQQPGVLARTKRVTVVATGLERALAEERQGNREAWEVSQCPDRR